MRINNLEISDKGLAIIKEFEQSNKFAAYPYICPAGLPTIGWGHVILKTDNFTYPMTREKADELLRKDAKIASEAINNLTKVPLNQNQFDALCSFVYNIGVGAFQDSTLLKKLNMGLYNEAKEELARWVY